MPSLVSDVINNSTTVPTRKETVAAGTEPTACPKRALTAGCIPTSTPATATSTIASGRLTRVAQPPAHPTAGASTPVYLYLSRPRIGCRRGSLRLQPILAYTDIYRHLRGVPPHATHLLLDQQA